MGYLIKIGIRGFLWDDLFPGWRNCALWGRLPTAADTIIPGITYTRSAEYHHIKTCRLSFLPHLLTFHLYCLSLLPFTSDKCRSGTCYLLSALNMPHMCYGANFQICDWNLSLCGKETWEVVVWRAWITVNVIYFYMFFLLSIYPVVAWYKYSISWQWQCFIFWTLQIIRAYCIFFLYTCMFSLDILRQERAIILCFYLSSSQYSNDLTVPSLLGNDDDAYQFYSLAEMQKPSKLHGSVEMIILRACLWGVNISAVGNEQTVQLQRE